MMRTSLYRNWLTALLVVVLCVACSRSAEAQFGGGGMGGGMGGNFGEVPTPKPTRFDDLTRVITTTIAADTWEQVGGPGSIQIVDNWGLMFVDQTSEVHDEIKSLLEVVRKVRNQQGQMAGGTGEGFLGGAKGGPKQIAYSLESSANMDSTERIEAVLDDKTSLELIESPLEEVVDVIRNQHDIPVLIDLRSLEDIGLSGDSPITKSLKGVSLRSALRLLLRDLDLTYSVRDGLLIITTVEAAESQLVTLVYPVEDLAIALKPAAPVQRIRAPAKKAEPEQARPKKAVKTVDQ